MKKIVRQRIAREERQIEQRLKAAVVVNEVGRFGHPNLTQQQTLLRA